MAPYPQLPGKNTAIAHAPSQTLGSHPGSIHCILCDSSGHAHGTVRLIFAPQGPLHYRQGQILQVLLPDGQGPEILITSHPRDSGMMHGRLLLGPGEALPTQFGPDAAFGWMFQVCLRHKRRAH